MLEKITICPPERLDANTAAAFEKQVGVAIAGGTDLCFDLSNTSYVSSAGLRVFLSAQKKMNACGKEMTLIHVKPQIMEIFEVTGLSGVLAIL